MAILIDGYNLLHVTGIVGSGIGPGTLERSRGALLNFIASVVTPFELPRTTVVFDAKDAPPGLPNETKHRGIQVLYARGYEDADTLIEELIRADSSPRQLLVVSSDNRIQRAARRRRATAINSDAWYEQLLRRRREQVDVSDPIEFKPKGPLSEEEIRWWLDEFGDVAIDDEREKPKVDSSQPRDDVRDEELKSDHHDDLANPFPPGYAEDLLADEVDDPLDR